MTDEPFIAESDNKTPEEVAEAIRQMIYESIGNDVEVHSGSAMALTGQDATAIGAALTVCLALSVNDKETTDRMMDLLKLALSPVGVVTLAQTFFDNALSLMDKVDFLDNAKSKADRLTGFLEMLHTEKQTARERPDYPSSSTEGAD